MTIAETCKTVYVLPATEDSLLFKRVSCIYYPIYFKKNHVNVQAFLNSVSKINTITLFYMAKLDLKIQTTNIKKRKINKFILKMCKIVLASF